MRQPIDLQRDSFSLRDVVSEVYQDSTLTGPAQITAAVIERIHPHDRLAALREALYCYVREFIGRERPASRHALERAGDGSDDGGKGKRRAQGRTVPRRTRSDLYREALRRMLDNRIHVATGDSWKRLGDCGVTDLEFAVKELRQMAVANSSKARWYAAMRDAVRTHGVERVQDLPVAVRDRLLVDRSDS